MHAHLQGRALGGMMHPRLGKAVRRMIGLLLQATPGEDGLMAAWATRALTLPGQCWNYVRTGSQVGSQVTAFHVVLYDRVRFADTVVLTS